MTRPAEPLEPCLRVICLIDAAVARRHRRSISTRTDGVAWMLRIHPAYGPCSATTHRTSPSRSAPTIVYRSRTGGPAARQPRRGWEKVG